MPQISETIPLRRFSLKTVFVAVLIVAMGLALVVSTRELLGLRKENTQLRAEAGFLTASDPDKVAVLLVPTHDPLAWRWKVHLPKGRWLLHSATQNIPQIGLAVDPRRLHVNNVGSEVISLSIGAFIQKGDKGQWQLVTEFQGTVVRTDLATPSALTAPRVTAVQPAGAGREDTFDPDQHIVLLRARATSTAGTVPTTPCDGLLLWLERKN